MTDDRRILRTRQTIEDAFIQLVHRKPFQSITIRDITDLANVNRTTFYSHYTDKYDLLDKTIDLKLQSLRALLLESMDSADNGSPAQPETADAYYIAFFKHLAEYESYYRIILTESFAQAHYGNMHNVVRESMYERILRIGPAQKLLIPLDLLLDYISISLMGIARKWLEQQMIYTPRYMALQLTRLSATGTYAAMGYGSRKQK